MRLPALTPLSRRWPLFDPAVLLLILVAVSAAIWAGTGPAGAQDSGELQVSVTADPTNLPVYDSTTLTSTITNSPSEETPTYNWEIDFGRGWLSFGGSSTFRYGNGKAETLRFRLTVTYDSGESATSEPVAVTWVAPEPTQEPTPTPTPTPSPEPTVEPTQEPTPEPTQEPTPSPTPTPEPTQEPTPAPSPEPTVEPTQEPTPAPTQEPTPTPTPTPEPTEEPTPAPPPSVSGVEVTSNAGGDDTYALSDTIRITLTFSEAVNVTGSPQLKIDMDSAEWGEKWAEYESGGGTASLTFAHTVVEPNYSTQGIAVLANSLDLNGGTIRSTSSDTGADLSHPGLPHDSAHKVDWQQSPSEQPTSTPTPEPTPAPTAEPTPEPTATPEPTPVPSVSGVEVTSDAGDDDTYALGNTIHITLTFSEKVYVTGSPQLAIDMDPAEWGEKQAAYISGSGTASLIFSYTVVEPNISTQGIAVLENSLDLNGGSIKSASSDTEAELSHDGLSHDAKHKVDWQRTRLNRAPVVNTQSANYKGFIGQNNAPRGVLVSKSFYEVFTDPDGDELTYTLAIKKGDSQLLDEFSIGLEYRTPENSHRSLEVFHRVWFQTDTDDNWEALTPPLPDPLVVTATVTATDPDGLSVSLDGDFLIHWEPDLLGNPPSGLTHTRLSSSQLRLDWNGHESFSYEVESRHIDLTESLPQRTPWARQLLTESGASSATMSGLTCTSEYDFRVRAVQGDAVSPFATLEGVDTYLEGGDDGDTWGGGGEDECYRGGGGDDVIAGGLGYDVIHGGAGDDVIYGGTPPVAQSSTSQRRSAAFGDNAGSGRGVRANNLDGLPGINSGPVALASSSDILISNLGQTGQGERIEKRDWGQWFQVGSSNSVGYTLTGVTVRMRKTTDTEPSYTVAVHLWGGGNTPGALLGYLNKPSSLPKTMSNVLFTAPGSGIHLTAGWGYVVVIDFTSTSTTHQWAVDPADTNGVEPGGEPGFVILSLSYYRAHDATTWGLTSLEELKIAIHGKGNTTGTGDGDTLYGGPGLDRIFGQAGNDILDGGLGHDALNGGAGHDVLLGQDGTDALNGEAGHDRLSGGLGDDTLDGGAGNDWLLGQDGDDSLTGGAGNDWLYGDQGFNGEDGDDKLWGGPGHDFMDGGFGANRMYGDPASAAPARPSDADWDNPALNFFNHVGTWSRDPRYDLSEGQRDPQDLPDDWETKPSWAYPGDTVSYYWATGPITVDLLTEYKDVDDDPATDSHKFGRGTRGQANGDQLWEIENVVGSWYDDIIIGSDGPGILRGGLGSDQLNGFSGHMYHAVDYRDSPCGVDVDLHPENGRGRNGPDCGTRASTAQGDTLIGIGGVHGSHHNDILRGSAHGNRLFGHDGDDTLYGVGSSDRLYGGPGSDTVTYAEYASGSTGGVNVSLTRGTAEHIPSTAGEKIDDVLDSIENVIGSSRNDIITASAAANHLDGGDGYDTAVYSASNAAVNVNLHTGQVRGGHAQGDTLVSIENVIGTGYDDTITGDAAANVIDGGQGHDTLTGGGDDDTLTGDSGRVIIGNLGQPSRVSSPTLDAAQQFHPGLHSRNYTMTGVTLKMLLTTTAAPTYTVSIVDNAGAGNPNGNVLGTLINPQSLPTDTTAGLTNEQIAERLVEVHFAAPDGGIQIGGDGQVVRWYYVTFDVTSANDAMWYLGETTSDEWDAGGETGARTWSAGWWRNHDSANWSPSFEARQIAVHGYKPGDDTLDGGDGDDTLYGLTGDDTLTGGAGGDTLTGGDGNDTADYSASNAAVNVNLHTGQVRGGHAQGDTLSSIESVTGSAHDDIITASAAANHIDGGSGSDTVDYARASAGVDVNLLTGRSADGEGWAEGDTYASIENVIGSGHDDTITGDAAANVLTGGAGGDTLTGGDGNDTADYSASNAAVNVNLHTGQVRGGHAQGDTLSSIESVTGSAHDDIITASAAANHLDGGSGSDTVDYVRASAGVDVNLLTGRSADDAGWAEGDTYSGIENVIGTGHDDTLTGDAAANVLTGGAGSDTLTGGAGTDTADYSGSGAAVTVDLSSSGAQSGGDAQGDTLTSIENVIGSGHDDTLTGDAAANVLTGGAGGDTLTGGDGNDTADYSGSGAAVTVDLSSSGAQSGGDAQGDTLTSIENVIGSGHDDTLTGDAAANVIDGGSNRDRDRVLVSNLGQTSTESPARLDIAQAFTTGANSGGYSLTGADMKLKFASSIQNYTVKIHKNSSGSPGDAVGTLTKPGSVPSVLSDVQFKAPGDGIQLSASTQYWVVFDVTSTNPPVWNVGVTTSDAEDSGAAQGWNISNGRVDRAFNTTVWTAADDAVQITIHGYESGADTLIGGEGNDTLTGGPGNDTFGFFATDSWNDIITDYNAGTSSDRLILCGDAELATTAWSKTEAGSDSLVSVNVNGAPAGTITLKGATDASITNQVSAIRAGLCTPSPFQVWFGEGTPYYAGGRLFFKTESNLNNTSITCDIDGTEVNCPPGTLVNQAKAAGATVKISVTATSRDEETTTINVEGVIGGPSITQMGASGGNGKLVVGWTEPADAGTGAINGYIVQRRSGTSGAWTDVTKSASDRSHTFTGLANGTWQVRVRARNDAGDTDNTTHILGMTSIVRTVTLASANTNLPGAPLGGRVTPGDQKLSVTWLRPSPDTGALAHGYTVRYKVNGADDSTYVEKKAYPYHSDYRCEGASCTRLKVLEITGLTAGTTYVVQIKSHNANGDSDWVTIGTTHTPN